VKIEKLTLQNIDLHAGLAVCCCGEDFRFAGGQSGVPGDELGHDTPQSLQSQGQRRDIQKDNVSHLACRYHRFSIANKQQLHTVKCTHKQLQHIT